MKPSLFQSRKFWVMVADVAISNLVYWATNFLAPAISVHVLWLIGSWQPVVLMVIAGIAQEDSAFMTSEATKAVATTTVGTPPISQ